MMHFYCVYLGTGECFNHWKWEDTLNALWHISYLKFSNVWSSFSFKRSWEPTNYGKQNSNQAEQLLFMSLPKFVISRIINLFDQRTNLLPIHRSVLCLTKGLFLLVKTACKISKNWLMANGNCCKPLVAPIFGDYWLLKITLAKIQRDLLKRMLFVFGSFTGC